MNSTDHKRNWVLERANCTPQDTFNRLAKIIQRDVRTFCKMSPENRAGRLFLVEPNGSSLRVLRAKEIAQNILNPGETVVKDEAYINNSDEQISVRLEDDCIRASRGQRWNLEIHSRWNATALSCDIFIKGGIDPPAAEKEVSLEQASQRLLGDFLFGE